MSVYVDELREHDTRLKWKVWCHMTADTDEELHAMADLIGLKTPLKCIICKQWALTNKFVQTVENHEYACKNVKHATNDFKTNITKTIEKNYWEMPKKEIPLIEQPHSKRMAINVNVVKRTPQNFYALTTPMEEEENTGENCLGTTEGDTAFISGLKPTIIPRSSECFATIATCLWDCMDIAHIKNKHKWCWFQPHPRGNHYDLTPSRRKLAVKHGAIEEHSRARVRRLRAINPQKTG